MPDVGLLIEHMIRQIKHNFIRQALAVLLKHKLRIGMAALSAVIHQIVVEPYNRFFDIYMYGVGQAVQL